MKMRWAWILLPALMAACAKDPFEPNPMPVLENPQPTMMRDSFAQSIPKEFTSDDTLIIQAPFHDDMAFLGVTRVDRVKGTFEFVALNHMGIKLFDLRGDRTKVEIALIFPPLEKLKEILLAIAGDMQHIYLDLTPTEAAKYSIESNYLEFEEKTPDGTLTYQFGGSPSILLEKRLSGFFGTIWRARYFRYTSASGGLYPRGIVMDNKRYHYRIIVKNRDVEFGR